MTVIELIERLHRESPDALKNMDDRKATRLLRAAFRAIAADLEAAEDGTYKVAGLGVFRIRTVEPNADGKGGGRRVLFRTVAPKAEAHQ